MTREYYFTCVELGGRNHSRPHNRNSRPCVNCIFICIRRPKKKKKKENHANLNETVSIVAVIENPFFVNYGFSKAFSTVTNLKQKKLVIVEVGGFENGHVKLMLVCARVFVFWTKKIK